MIESVKLFLSCFDLSISMSDFKGKLAKRDCRQTTPTTPRVNRSCLRNKPGALAQFRTRIFSAIGLMTSRNVSKEGEAGLEKYQQMMAKKKTGTDEDPGTSYALQHLCNNYDMSRQLTEAYPLTVLKDMADKLATSEAMNPQSESFDPLHHMLVAGAINLTVNAPTDRESAKVPSSQIATRAELAQTVVAQARQGEKWGGAGVLKTTSKNASEAEIDAAMAQVLHQFPLMSLENRAKLNTLLPTVANNEATTPVSRYDAEKFPLVHGYDTFADDLKSQIAELAQDSLSVANSTASDGDVAQRQAVRQHIKNKLEQRGETSDSSWKTTLLNALIDKEVARIIAFSEVPSTRAKTVSFVMPDNLEQ
ncbi:hypothetical protein [Rugamonas aquatica]|uniref:Uncharacterized protein n=1 Tax=Rugamonas aquatica TaxID=2743357 RepID=A0A6A7N764_9BURK|nr:hypothetical protein [Rugamonas aquatica]MQA40712.1 hypothetical protein [Rugamonas aquatica]